MVMWEDLRGGRCSMGDACSNPSDEEGVHEMLMKNFNRHYKSNKAPLGLFYHSAWFNTQHHRRGLIKFLDEILTKKDVYVVTNWQMLQWMRNPTPLSQLENFEPWNCRLISEQRPRSCNRANVCNVESKSGSRFMKTCQPCPNFFPWLGKTGF
ncbi:peritrophic membrane chitin binding protein-like protein [Leptotrombidium deliense]|uniref:Peritrophic membrane chitin binding protein-like protein n=1 Tax=Leptotrombidium deliense TaxID=299467 RepID=A0A443S8C1_9ACAR|nr:peritrophic membrane chitin binding protein-like protein [Leptotrombidium deliense]